MAVSSKSKDRLGLAGGAVLGWGYLSLKLRVFASETQVLRDLSLWAGEVSNVPVLELYQRPELIVGMWPLAQFAVAVLVVSFGFLAVGLASLYILVHAVANMQFQLPGEPAGTRESAELWEFLEPRLYNAILVLMIGGFSAPLVFLIICCLHAAAAVRVASWLGHSFFASMLYLAAAPSLIVLGILGIAGFVSSFRKASGSKGDSEESTMSQLVQRISLSRTKKLLPGAAVSYCLILLVGHAVARHSYHMSIELERDFFPRDEGGYVAISSRLGGIAADPRMSRLELVSVGEGAGICLDRLALGGGEYLSIVPVKVLEPGEYEVRLVFSYLQDQTLNSLQVNRETSRFFLAI